MLASRKLAPNKIVNRSGKARREFLQKKKRNLTGKAIVKIQTSCPLSYPTILLLEIEGSLLQRQWSYANLAQMLGRKNYLFCHQTGIWKCNQNMRHIQKALHIQRALTIVAIMKINISPESQWENMQFSKVTVITHAILLCFFFLIFKATPILMELELT